MLNKVCPHCLSLSTSEKKKKVQEEIYQSKTRMNVRTVFCQDLPFRQDQNYLWVTLQLSYSHKFRNKFWRRTFHYRCLSLKFEKETFEAKLKHSFWDLAKTPNTLSTFSTSYCLEILTSSSHVKLRWTDKTDKIALTR